MESLWPDRVPSVVFTARLVSRPSKEWIYDVFCMLALPATTLVGRTTLRIRRLLPSMVLRTCPDDGSYLPRMYRNA
jgi:hypothetical protein